MTDPLGLSPEQRWQSDRNERVEAFVERWGDRIQLADDGTWFVWDGDKIATVPLPPWPKAEKPMGEVRPVNYAQALRMMRCIRN